VNQASSHPSIHTYIYRIQREEGLISARALAAAERKKAPHEHLQREKGKRTTPTDPAMK
jgi:hypothetical protein